MKTDLIKTTEENLFLLGCSIEFIIDVIHRLEQESEINQEVFSLLVIGFNKINIAEKLDLSVNQLVYIILTLKKDFSRIRRIYAD